MMSLKDQLYEYFAANQSDPATLDALMTLYLSLPSMSGYD